MQAPLVLAIDQGTTSTRAIVFEADSGRPRASAQRELGQHFPRDGWVEHDPEEIWTATVAVGREALARAGETRVAALGITNQRETTLVWERASGRPVAPAIVWQDRRTAGACAELRRTGAAELVAARTGLVIDPYFSATKIRWLLDHVEGARARAERGELAFGTVDAWLLWRLTGGAVHATDATNASRTLLFDIHAQAWDPELLELFGVPGALLPEVRDSAGTFGETEPGLFGRAIPITGVAGDQQAATVGQACFAPGMAKSTYGTGCFLVLNTGEQAVRSRNHLLTTVAYRLGGRPTYALEGAIFAAGSTVQWLRDRLGAIGEAAETETLARSLDGNHGVYLIPAFTGLGAPHWDPEARAAVLGLTRASGVAELARAALEAVAYQTRDLLAAMIADGAERPRTLRVDGGMVANDWMLQFLADIIDLEVERPEVIETTALGAASLAALGGGLCASLDELAGRWRSDERFVPAIDDAARRALVAGWEGALARVRLRPAGEEDS